MHRNVIVLDIGSRYIKVGDLRNSRILVEPSCVAHLTNGQVVAVGSAAIEYEDRTPSDTYVVWPSQQGVIDAYQHAVALQQTLLQKLRATNGFFQRCTVLLVLSDDISSVAKRTAVETVLDAGASEVYSVRHSVAALGIVSAKRPRREVVVSVGAGTTTFSAYSNSGAVSFYAFPFGGDVITERIAQFARVELGMQLGWGRCEQVKRQHLTVSPHNSVGQRTWLSGKATVSGLPVRRRVDVTDFNQVVVREVRNLVEFLRATLHKHEHAGSELSVRVIGGGAGLDGLAQYLSRELKVEVSKVANHQTHIVENAALLWQKPEYRVFFHREAKRWRG